MARATLIACLALLVSAGSAGGAYPGKNGRIAFVRNGVIYTIDAGGKDLRRLTTGENPAWSADGKTIAFDRANKGVFTIGADGRHVRQLTKTFEYDPSWSPDGRKLVVVSNNPPEGAECEPTAQYQILYTVQADGTGLSNLTTASDADDVCSVPGGQSAPAWSPKGDRIAFVHSELVVHDIYDTDLRFMSPAGKAAKSSLTSVGAPAWSPDAKLLAWSAAYNGNRQVFVAAPAAKKARRLTGAKAGSYQPAWSPDGAKVVFSRKGGTQQGLLVLDLRSGKLTQLTKSAADGQPDWQPSP